MGDSLELQLSDGSTKSYKITVSQISKTPKLTTQDQLGDYDKLILTTCWPFNAIQSGPERFIIIGEAT
jgi:sortase A